MDIIKPGTRFSFVEKQKPFLIASAVAVALSVVMIALFGLNYGVDFRGGTEVILAFKQPVNADQVRGATQTIGFVAADVQSFGAASENRYLVRVPSATLLTEANTQALQQSIAKDIAPTKRFSWTEEGGDIIYVRFEKGQLGEEEEKKLSESLAKAPVGPSRSSATAATTAPSTSSSSRSSRAASRSSLGRCSRPRSLTPRRAWSASRRSGRGSASSCATRG
jgi:preprotein translocase subunit SecD